MTIQEYIEKEVSIKEVSPNKFTYYKDCFFIPSKIDTNRSIDTGELIGYGGESIESAKMLAQERIIYEITHKNDYSVLPEILEKIQL
jgi:hypothetical protein